MEKWCTLNTPTNPSMTMEGAIVEEDDVADVQYMDIGEHELDCELDN
ncbi:unnamed protein product, partial [Rotaria magnacalcarata]